MMPSDDIHADTDCDLIRTRPAAAAAAWVRAHEATSVAFGAIVVALALCSDLVFRGRALFYGDIDPIWHGSAVTLVRCIAKGSWPTWSPFQAFGQPFLANPLNQVLYPTTWLHAILPFSIQVTVSTVIHLSLACVGAYALARQLGLWRGAAFVAGCLYGASGPVVASATMPNMLIAAAWLPWTWWGALRTCRSGSLRDGALWGIFLALAGLSGSTEIALLSVAGVPLAFVVGSGGSLWIRLRRMWLPGGIALVVALTLTAGLWLPALQMFAQSSGRALGMGRGASGHWAIAWPGWLQVFLPLPLDDLPLKQTLRRELFGSSDAFLVSLYLGLPSVALVLAAFFSRRRRALVVLTLAATLAATLAMGNTTPVFGVALRLVPPLGIFRYPVKLMLLMALVWALMAGLGVATLRSRRSRTLSVLVASTSFVLGMLAWWLSSGSAFLWGWLFVSRRQLGYAYESSATVAHALGDLRWAAGSAAAVGIAAVLSGVRPHWRRWAAGMAGAACIVELVSASHAIHATVPRALMAYRPEILSKVPTARPNRVLILGYSSPDQRKRFLGQRPMIVLPLDASPAYLFASQRSYPVVLLGSGLWGIEGISSDVPGLRQYRVARVIGDLNLAVGKGPLFLRELQVTGVDYVASLHTKGLDEMLVPLGASRTLEGEAYLFRVPEATPRVFVAHGARQGDEAAGLSMLISADFPLLHGVVLPHLDTPHPSPPDAHGSARIRSYVPDALDVDVESNAPGYLVVLDAYDPGWNVTVDSIPAKSLRANVIFRAVAVPAGRHRVVWRYRPRGVFVGLGLSGLGVLLCGTILGWPWLRQASVRTSRGSTTPAQHETKTTGLG
jgi:hypothetical protein